MKLPLSLFLLGLLMVGASLLMISSCSSDDGRPRNCDGIWRTSDLKAAERRGFHIAQLLLRQGKLNDTMAYPLPQSKEE